MIYEEDFENQDNAVEPLLVRKVEAASETAVESLGEEELDEITGGGSIGGTVKNGGTYDVYVSKNATNFKVTNAMLGGYFSRFITATINWVSNKVSGKAVVKEEQVDVALKSVSGVLRVSGNVYLGILGTLILMGKDKKGNNVQVKVKIHAI